MLKEWRLRRAVRRVEPGDGRPLKPFRWWQTMFRGLFHFRLPDGDGGRTLYSVDVRHWMNQSSGDVRAQLYRDRRLHRTEDSQRPGTPGAPGRTGMGPVRPRPPRTGETAPPRGGARVRRS
ncbi:hypothetical protein [Streptomyces sp. NPDC007083]|uniref:hypothetical protein n=1 Tax=unclassified Streptomyces TaxID=2593676 RepID=UPI0033CFF963